MIYYVNNLGLDKLTIHMYKHKHIMHKQMEGTRIALLINRSQGSYKQLLQHSINLLT